MKARLIHAVEQRAEALAKQNEAAFAYHDADVERLAGMIEFAELAVLAAERPAKPKGPSGTPKKRRRR